MTGARPVLGRDCAAAALAFLRQGEAIEGRARDATLFRFEAPALEKPPSVPFRPVEPCVINFAELHRCVYFHGSRAWVERNTMSSP
jgi:hypothetical protein